VRYAQLKREIVRVDFLVPVECGRVCGLLRGFRRNRGCSRGTLGLWAELEAFAHDLGRTLIVTLFIFPATRSDAAFDEDEGALRDVLASYLCGAPPEDDIVELELFLGLIVFIFPAAIRRHSE
jgi:hypothetical protein